MPQLPAVSLAAVPGKRQRILDLAVEIERRGFSGVHCPSFGDAVGLCLSLAHVTTTLELATSIQPIYLRHPADLAQASAFVQEISGGRFRLGIGVSHGPVVDRLGVETGKPLADVRAYVAALRDTERQAGPLPPIVLATLRDKMLGLAVEIADGAVWANASRSHMAAQLALVPAAQRADRFSIGNMIPTVIDDDREAARAVHRRTLAGYVALPNYRNYWKAAGYEDEMTAIEEALAAKDRDAVPGLMGDRWLDDATLSGSAAQVREGVEAWFDAGVTTPILVMSSTRGGQQVAFEELFAAYA
ncbi:MAG: LLM class flavin-dependent oxidoreductase [Actinomycetota bacterium]|nr:LLM class flavin-dependent oxidoreductase [Actinomycetota bacterium]